MLLVVYLHGTDGSVTRVGSRPTEDPQPYCLVNIAHALAVTKAARVVPRRGQRLVVAVEDPIAPFEPIFQHAGPVIRHALSYAAERSQAPRLAPERRHAYQGQFDGLAQALEIMLNSADTEVEPGIAWPDLLPDGALEHTRRLLYTPDHADWLLGQPLS